MRVAGQQAGHRHPVQTVRLKNSMETMDTQFQLNKNVYTTKDQSQRAKIESADVACNRVYVRKRALFRNLCSMSFPPISGHAGTPRGAPHTRSGCILPPSTRGTTRCQTATRCRAPPGTRAVTRRVLSLRQGTERRAQSTHPSDERDDGAPRSRLRGERAARAEGLSRSKGCRAVAPVARGCFGDDVVAAAGHTTRAES